MFGNDKILTIDDVAKVLKVNKRTVYRWIETGDLKVARLGKKTFRVFESDLKKFLRNFVT